jgi:hypothetical protein
MYPLARRVIAALVLLFPSVASAQVFEDSTERPIRGAAGASFTYGRPVGDFLRFVHEGYGFDAFLRWNLEPQGLLSLKLDGGFLVYGSETLRVPLSSTVGARILVDLTTSNNIAWMGFGPQLTLPIGPFRPYGSAAIGFSYFFTESSVEGSDDTFDFANTTNFEDFTSATLWLGRRDSVPDHGHGVGNRPRRDVPWERAGEVPARGWHHGPAGRVDHPEPDPERREPDHVPARVLGELQVANPES